MERWILMLFLLPLTTTLTDAWNKTFCQEGRFKCNSELLSCPGKAVIKTEYVLYLPGESCSGKHHPIQKYVEWRHCCCEVHINDTLYDNKDYRRRLITFCDNKTSCNVYTSLPLNRQYGQVTIVFNCIVPNQPRTTLPTPTRTDKVSTKHTTLVTNNQTVHPLKPTKDGESPVAIIIVCIVILLLITGIVIGVILFRLRKGRMLKSPGETVALKSREEPSPPENMDDYYSEINPHGCEPNSHRERNLYAACSSDDADGYTICPTSKTNSVQPGAQDGCDHYDKVDRTGQKDTTNRDVLYDHADHKVNPCDTGAYDRVGHKVGHIGTGTYDHVGHQLGKSGTGPYDRIGGLKANSAEEDSEYDTCVRREAYTSAHNTQEGGSGYPTGDSSEYDHITATK